MDHNTKNGILTAVTGRYAHDAVTESHSESVALLLFSSNEVQKRRFSP
ncbi:MAG: hypothetical protein HXS48_10975 [Theionarchaea archaeon]|nr:hypothetical protein [Theionarchaea archaeon]